MLMAKAARAASGRRRAAGPPAPRQLPSAGARVPGRRRAPAPTQQDLVAAAIGAAVQAVCDGSRDAHGAHLDPLAIERTPGWTQAVSRALVESCAGR